MKAYRHVYLDFPGFTQESCYEVTSEVTFQNGDKDEIKTTVVCDNMKRIFYADGSYKEVEHYSVIHIIPNDLAIYYGKFDTKEAADERCAELNKKWEKYFGEQK